MNIIWEILLSALILVAIFTFIALSVEYETFFFGAIGIMIFCLLVWFVWALVFGGVIG